MLLFTDKKNCGKERLTRDFLRGAKTQNNLKTSHAKMSKLSRRKTSRSELPPGPVTSTQAVDDGEEEFYKPKARRPPEDRDEELFQKQLEAAIQASKANDEPSEKVSPKKSFTVPDPRPGPSGTGEQSNRRKAALKARSWMDQSDSEEEDFDDDEFMPELPAKKKSRTEQKKVEVAPKPAKNVENLLESKGDVESNHVKMPINKFDNEPSMNPSKSAPVVPDVSSRPTRIKKTITTKKALDNGDDHNSEDDEYSDDEEFIALKKKAKTEAKKAKSTAEPVLTKNVKNPVGSKGDVESKEVKKPTDINKAEPKLEPSKSKPPIPDDSSRPTRIKRTITVKKAQDNSDDDSEDDFQDDPEDDDYSEDEEFTAPKKKKAAQAKKETSSKTKVRAKKDENSKPAVKASTKSVVSTPTLKSPLTSRGPFNSPLMNKPTVTSSSPKSSTHATSVKTPVNVVRTKIPKWTPPAMAKDSPRINSTSLTPKTMGLRVGLSRNFKAKPLHSNVKFTP